MSAGGSNCSVSVFHCYVVLFSPRMVEFASLSLFGRWIAKSRVCCFHLCVVLCAVFTSVAGAG